VATTNKLPIEIFMPPNMLKAKVGGPNVTIDASMIRRAEAVLEDLKTEFGTWIAADVEKLVDARDRFAALCDNATRGELFRGAHDLRGGAKTYEYPLIGRVAASLSRLIEGTEKPDAIPLALVDAHVHAIKVMLRQDIKDPSNRTALHLAEELEARVTERLEA
jgi:hypothetical protein